MMKDNSNRGFSLIELIIALSILMILSGMLFLGTNSARRKETEKYVNVLSNQIRLSQTTAMSKSGKWRLGLYLKDNDFYCVHETEKGTSDDTGNTDWEIQSEKVMLGRDGAIRYEPESEGNGAFEDSGEKGTLIWAWRFSRDTGSCLEGAGTLAVTGVGKTKYLTVYRENGRCEVSGEKE